ncbi:recombinase family protein [Thalassobellus suaedae]|uniref:Recombinase family protein n=1 Tax=Thalassobellus suaedae TaxID=3074124 RepID=A0ABY9XYR7_9FLAO|nr:recombinase family protein [Flavobacteriaceae bacterium HL-DH14]
MLNTISIFNSKKINIHFIQQGLQTLNEDGTENIISKMIISILGVVAEMEPNLIRERQKEGILIAKVKGVYKGRREGTTISDLEFMNKVKVKRQLSI